LWWVVAGSAAEQRTLRSNSPLTRNIIPAAGKAIALFVWAACMGAFHAGAAGGFPPPRFENATERVLGTIGPIAAEQSEAAGDVLQDIIVEAGTIRLFDLADFGVDGMRVSLARSRFRASLYGATTSAPVGGEHAAGLSLHAKTASRITLGMRLDGALLSLDGCERSVLLTTSSFVLTRLARGLSVACVAEDLYLRGETLHGIDLSLCAVAQCAHIATAVFTLRIDRWGEVSMGYAASIRMGTHFSGLIGYEGASEQVKTAVALSNSSWTCEVCVLLHPVLGMSRGIFLQWRR
jgi:hypothetical protein